MRRDYPLVNVIVVHWGSPENTIACLDSLSAISYPNWRAIVVDNGPDPHTLAARLNGMPFVDLIVSPTNVGFSAGANAGIERALDGGADYVLLLNNDTLVAPDFLEPLVELCESRTNVGIVGPKVYYYGTYRLYSGGGWPRRWLPLLVRQLHTAGLEESTGEVVVTPQRVGYIWGQAMLIRRAVLEKVGLLDTHFFMYYEDCDLCRRATEAGYELYFVPKSRIWHRVAIGTQGNEWRRWCYYIASMYYFYRKHGRLGKPGALIATVITLAGIMWEEIRKGNVRWLGYPLKALYRRLLNGESE